MNLQAILASIAAFGSSITAFASAYRLVVLTVAGLLVLLFETWAFIFSPRSLVLLNFAAAAGCVYGPQFIAWSRGKA